MKKVSKKQPKIVKEYFENGVKVTVYEYVEPNRNQKTFNK